MAIDNLSSLDPNGTYTYADYLTWRFAEMVELIKGRIYRMSPAPADPHQAIVLNLGSLAKSALKKTGCTVRIAPSDVRLPVKGGSLEDGEVYTVVQPDVYVVCDRTKMDRKGCKGAPDLIIEVISPGTGSRDLNEKKSLYAEAGVGIYWLAFPGEKMLLCYRLSEGVYMETGTYALDEGGRVPFSLGTGENAYFELEDVFEDVD